jgi:hypothetical protein
MSTTYHEAADSTAQQYLGRNALMSNMGLGSEGAFSMGSQGGFR